MARQLTDEALHISSVVVALVTAKKLRGRALAAAVHLSFDWTAATGSSAGTVASYGESSGGASAEYRAPAFHVSAAAQRLEALQAYLHPTQRVLLGELLRGHGRPWNAIQAWGMGAGYKTDDAQRAAGVQRVIDLLESVGDFYGVGQDVKRVEEREMA